MSTAKKKLIIVLSIIGVFVILLIVFGTLFSVRTINVDKATYLESEQISSKLDDYLTEDIVKVSGVKKGKNIIFLNTTKAENNLESSFPYARFKIVRTFPNKVTIYMYERIPVFRILKEGNWYVFDESLKCLDIVADANLHLSGVSEVPTLSGVTLELCEKGGFINDVQFQARLASIIDGVYGASETSIDIMSDILLDKNSISGVDRITFTVKNSNTKIVVNGTDYLVEKIAAGVYIYESQISNFVPDNNGNVHEGHLEDVTIEVLDKYRPKVNDDSIRVVCTNDSHKS